MRIIEITVDTKGQSKVETRGFTGGECREASKFIEQALGQRTDEKLTAEFYQDQTDRPAAQAVELIPCFRSRPPHFHLTFNHRKENS